MPVIIKKFIAEIIGTFIFLFIALAIGIITGGNLLITAIGFGVGITTAILIVGHVSGAHLNPAVSLACVLNKKMTWKEFAWYVGAQIIGAILASVALFGIFEFTSYTGVAANAYVNGLYNIPAGTINIYGALIVEIILTFIFVSAVLLCVDKGEKFILIGVALIAVHLVGILLTGTSVNPARSIGPAIVAMFNNDFEPIKQVWVFIVGPMLGATGAAYAFKYFFTLKQKSTESHAVAVKETKTSSKSKKGKK